MTDPLDRLSADVAEALGEGPGPGRLLEQRAGVIAESDRGTSTGPGSSPRWLAVPAVVAVAALAVLGWVLYSPGEEGGGGAVEARVGARRLAATEYLGDAESAEPVAVRFSEGSRVTVEAGSRARLARLESREVHLSVEAGSVDSAIVPGTGVEWSFLAGPYRVVVVGTRLRVSWQPAAGRLDVVVSEGRVRVEGGELGEEGVAVAEGQRLRASRQSVHLSRDDEAEGTSESLEGDGGAPEANQVARTGRATSSARDGGPGDAPQVDWRQLAEGGRYQEAVAAAEGEGFDRLVEELPPFDLLLLADAARLGGDIGEARRALEGLRRRFPGSRPAAVAAFRLGRLAYDHSRDYGEAARWFRIVLDEAPAGGAHTADARGRLMEALARQGQRAEAAEVAGDYLRLHPRGAYREAARALLEGGEPE